MTVLRGRQSATAGMKETRGENTDWSVKWQTGEVNLEKKGKEATTQNHPPSGFQAECSCSGLCEAGRGVGWESVRERAGKLAIVGTISNHTTR